jgi:hypothetical protein
MVPWGSVFDTVLFNKLGENVEGMLIKSTNALNLGGRRRIRGDT